MSVKWGVLGTAGIAKGCTIPGMKQAAGCELYAIAGRNEDKVRSYKEEFGFEKSYIGYENLLADEQVQAVYIPLPNQLHKEWVIKALKAGKHVLCEKPLSLSAEDVRQMQAQARESGVILMEAYAYLHSPYILSLQEDIRSGIIGDVDYIETAFLTQGYVDDIRIRRETGGGSIYDLGCYCTTLILSILGAQASASEQDTKTEYVKGCAEFNDAKIDLFSSVQMKFKGGARADFNVGMIFDPAHDARQDRLYVHGSKGTIRSDVEYNQAGTLSYTVEAGGEKTVRTVEARHNYALEIEQMGRCIEKQEIQHIRPEFTLKNAELIDEILKQIGY